MNSKQALHLQFREDQWIRYNVKLSKKVGIYGSILLGYLINKEIYFSGKGQLVDDAYFYATRDTIEEYTALSPHQQREAIKALKECGFLVTKDMCTPRKTFYAIVHDKLSNFLTTSDQKIEPLDVENLNDIYKNKYMSPNNEHKHTIQDVHAEHIPDKVDHATQPPSIPLLLHALTVAAINKSPVDKDVIVASYKRYAKQIKESLIGVSPEELVYMILWARDEDSQPLAWFEEKKTLPKPATIAELIARYRPHAYPSDPTENARWIKGLEQCGLYVTHELFTTPY